MELVHSKCYPDKEKIDFYQSPISEHQAYSMLVDFDWNEELKKPLKYCSPSIDFIKLRNRKRIVLSGIGNSKLEEFQIMFIEPISNYNNDIFNEKNYYNTDSYSKNVSISDGYKMFQMFISGNYSKLKNQLNNDLISVEYKIKSRHRQKGLSNTQVDIDLHPFFQKLLRILSPLLVLFFWGLTFIAYKFNNEVDGIVILFGGIGLAYALGIIYYEFIAPKKKHR